MANITGIVRKMDPLGRIVIPKEVRDRYGIKEGTPMEIMAKDSGEIILHKYTSTIESCDSCGDIPGQGEYPLEVSPNGKIKLCVSCLGAMNDRFKIGRLEK